MILTASRPFQPKERYIYGYSLITTEITRVQMSNTALLL
jgi:hypothetical protein